MMYKKAMSQTSLSDSQQSYKFDTIKFSFPQTWVEAYHSCDNDIEDTSCLKDEGRGADHQLPEINTLVK